jgi:hypothetical protein
LICINNHNILINEQFGFRSKSSTEKSSCTLIHETEKAFNNKRLAVSTSLGCAGKWIFGSKYMNEWISFDLEKALNCVNHIILLSKSEVYGITDKVYTLIKSYLEGREQRLICKYKFLNNNTCSVWGIVKHGVPQGSVMGPLLFFLFILTAYLMLRLVQTEVMFLK